MSIVRQDTFTRANVASGWGTATDGNVWTSQAGTGGYNVTSNEGQIAGPSTASYFNTLGATLATADAEGLVRFSPTTGTSNDTAGIILRFADTNNYYLARWSAASAQIQFFRKVGGTSTTVGNYAISMAVGAHWWMRFRVQGSTISIKTWLDGNSEPGTWSYTTTDTGLSAAGKAGLYGFGGGSSQNIQFDNFSVDNLVAPTSLTLQTQTTFKTLASQLAAARSTFKVYTSLRSLVTESVGKFRSRAAQTTEAIEKFLVKLPTGAGTGIGDLTVTTKSESWSGGPAGSPGTETDVTYVDASGSGWSAGMIPSYGAMTVAPIYQVTGNAQGTDQTSLTTSNPDGHIHWLNQKGTTFAGSEDVTYKNAGNFTELAPVGTVFRRGYKAIGDANDANGFQWTFTTYFYPGDPGYMVYRLDMHNPSGSAITLAGSDSLEIALMGGLQQVDSTWSPANGGYGIVGGANTVGWPSSLTSVEPDYVYIVPATGSGVSIGQVTAKKTSLAGLGWSSLQIVYLQAASRLKLKIQGTDTTIPAGATQTVYLTGVLRRNLTAADAAAIAADYINPGTPSGPFTTFSYDERAYTFDATGLGNAFSTQFSLSGTGVTARYKPVLKVLGWTQGAVPALTWGGSPLTAGTDFRWLFDSNTNTLYIQLYFDVVASGATAGQKNNALLTVGTKALTGTARNIYKTRATQSATARDVFKTRISLAEAGRTKFLTRTALAAQTRSKFLTRMSLVAATRSPFLIRLALKTGADATFKVKNVYKQLALAGTAVFKTRLGVTAGTRSTFKARATVSVPTHSRFLIRFTFTTSTRARFLTRLSLGAGARVRSITAARLRSMGISTFVTSALHVNRPFSAVFKAAKMRLNAAFALKVRLTATFSRSPAVTQAYSTIQSSATLTDIAGLPVTNATSVTVTVTFPDGSTTSYALASGVTNAGGGVYTLQYATKGPGLHTELWTFTDSSGDTAEYKNYQSAVL